MFAKNDPRPGAVGRIALAALAFLTVLPALSRAQDVLCDDKEREVRAVKFEGNTTFTADQLSARVLTTPSSATRRLLMRMGITSGGTRRCFPDIGLANDVANLRTLYRNQGFYDTRVDTVVSPLTHNRVDVTFRITEGQPLILDSLAITGLDAVPLSAGVLRDTLLKLGQPVGQLLALAQQDTITNRLRNAGYPRAQVFPSFQTRTSEHRAEVGLDVQPGPRAHFGTINVRSVSEAGGKGKIDSAVVLQLIGFRSGDLYSDRALSSATRNLYNLSGVYRHVGITTDTTWVHGDSVADVTVDLREDYLRQFDVDGGWGQLDCFRGNVVYTDKNFQDQARRFQLDASVSKLGYAKPAASNFTRNFCDTHALDADSLGSSKINDHIGTTVTFPTLFGRQLTPSYSVYTERKSQYLAYLRTTDLGFAASATRDLGQQTPFTFGYSLEHGQTRAEPVVLCALFSRCTTDDRAAAQQRLALGIASAAIRRNATDNLVAPQRGYTAAFETRYSAPFLISDPSQKFFKMTGDVAWYSRVVSGVTLMLRARGGFIVGGEEENGAKLPPFQERLFAGGPTTVRGFQQSQLGPQVYLLDHDVLDSIPVSADSFYYQSKSNARQSRSIPGGGNLLAVLNSELRIRDPFFPGLIEYAPFIDWGQVWITQIEKANVNRTPLVVTPGLSVRYFSPFGPVAVNLAYNPYKPQAGAAYYLTDVNVPDRPLICVTSPGETPVIVSAQGGRLIQNQPSCPSTFVPSQPSNFFKHLNLTLSIGTDF